MENDLKKSIDQLTKEKNNDKINAHKLIEFLEYEEALTKDLKTATRIKLLLIELGIWEK